MRWFIKNVGLVTVAILSNQSSAQGNEFFFPPDIAQHLDLSVNPCDDFYKFSCGGWSRDFQMPADSVRYSLYTNAVEERNHKVLLEILKSNTSIVTTYFDSCMNTTRINQHPSTHLTKVIQQIDAVQNVTDLFKVVGELSLVGFSFLSNLNAMDISVEIIVLQLKPTSLPLPSSYYEFDERIYDIKPAYREYISTVLTQAQVANSSSVNTSVDTIIKLEQTIAKIMSSHNNLQDTRLTFQEASTNNPLLFKEVASGYFAKADVALPEKYAPVDIQSASYFEKLEKLLKSTDLDALKTLMKYQYVIANEEILGDEFITASFKLYGPMLDDMPERPSREKFCVDYVVRHLPNRMGKAYAALMFDTESANLATDMIVRIEAAMKERLLKTDWLDESTREKALKKLAKVTNLISHSDQVEALDGVTLNADDFFGNTDAIVKWKNLQKLRKFNKRGVRGARGEWRISGSKAKASFRHSQNTVVVPAGTLQPPFFSKSYLAAINYGATGTLMGHELIHAFDSTGRSYDGNGNKVSWSDSTKVSWLSKEATAAFDKRTQCLVEQYSIAGVKSSSPLHVLILALLKTNGKTTLDENIADVSGFSIAFEAYQKFIEQASKAEVLNAYPRFNEQPKPQLEKSLPELDAQVDIQPVSSTELDVQVDIQPVSFTKTELEKLFYVAFAQSLCVVNRDGLDDRGWDKHAPPYFRVTGTIMNNQYFGELFNCPKGTNMNPKDKCSLW